MEEGKSLLQRMDNLAELLEEQQYRGKKKFKLPLGVRLSKGKVKKGHIIVQTISTNGNVQFKMLPIDSDTVDTGKKIPQYHEATAEHILKYKKLPMIIVPEWSMKPFSPKENHQDTVKQGELSAAQKTIISKIEAEAIKKKSAINWVVILIVLAIGAGAIFLLDYLGLITF